MAPFIEARDLSHLYPLETGEVIAALSHVDLRIDPGEFIALIGANGSGKTTLAHHFNALLLPTSGQVFVDGLSTSRPENHWEVRRRVGMVFQNPENQLVASTVEEDVAFGPENWGLPRTEIRRRVAQALDIVGLHEYASTPPQMLSGGQKQLVAIAGVLASQPDCLVLDEPTSMLDPSGRERIIETIQELNAQHHLTIVLITQSMTEAASAERVLVMDRGEIAVDRPPGEAFSQREALRSLGLALPPAAEIAHLLRQAGISLDANPLTVAALTSALCSSSPRVETAC